MRFKWPILLCCFLWLSAFTAHKFYVSTTQIHFAPEKQRLEMSIRFFTDDLNLALSRSFGTHSNLGEPLENAQDVARLQNYLLQKVQLSVNGKNKSFVLVRHEFENNVLICYIRVPNTTKVKQIGVRNTSLFEVYPEQQHIVNAEVSGKRKTVLLTQDSPSGTLVFD